MSLTRHWSQRPCLSHFVLAHELRQAWSRLSFDVRQKANPMDLAEFAKRNDASVESIQKAIATHTKKPTLTPLELKKKNREFLRARKKKERNSNSEPIEQHKRKKKRKCKKKTYKPKYGKDGNNFASAQYFKERANIEQKSVYTVSGGLPGLGKRK
jgi:hypothetical protein